MSSNSKNQAKILFKPSYIEKFVNKSKEIKPLGPRLKDDLDTLKIKINKLIIKLIIPLK
jgi:hypothetical protein